MKNYWHLAKVRLILTALIPVVLGIVLGGYGWNRKQAASVFVENMREGEGEVIRINSGLDESVVEVEFKDDAGVPYRKQFPISPSQERDLRAIGKISVVYDARNPQISELGHIVSANNEMWLYWGVAAVGFASMIGGLAMVAVQARRVSAIGALFRSGQLVQTEVRNNALAPGAKVGRFTYAFRGPNGRWYEGRSPELPAAQLATWPVGRRIVIAYDPSNPLRSEADVYAVVDTKRLDAIQPA